MKNKQRPLPRTESEAAGIHRMLRNANLPAIVIIAAFFAISRTLYYLAGIRFYDWSDTHLMHYIPAGLLRGDLLQSILYLHIQPPLFNLYRGVVFSLVSGNGAAVFHAVSLLMGLFLSVTLFMLMKNLGVSRRIATILTVLFLVSPACVSFENVLLYPYMVALLLCAASLTLHRYLQGGKSRYAVIFFTLLSILVLTRSLFHLGWFGLCIGVLMVLRRHDWKRLAMAATVPFLLAFGLYAKNAVLFGDFSSSSWAGMSMAKMTVAKLSEEDRIDLVRKGEISELALLPPFNAVWYYSSRVNIPRNKETGIPVLDEEYFNGVGNNWNSLSYIGISRQYMKDSRIVFLKHPEAYLASLTESFRIFFFPASDWFHSMSAFDNRRVAWVERVYNILGGQVSSLFLPGVTTASHFEHLRSIWGMGFLIIVGYCIAVFWGGRFAISSWRTQSPITPSEITVLFMLGTILYVTLVGNLMEIGENNRFRFDIDPLVIVILGLFLTKVSNSTLRLANLRNGPSGKVPNGPERPTVKLSNR